MNDTVTAYAGTAVFDGAALHDGAVLLVAGERFAGIASDIPPGARLVAVSGGILAPGFVDLQVNGGGGVMFNDDPSPATLATIARAHARLGATAILPTLITDRPQATRAAIAAVREAVAASMPGIAGLHLEGPHIALARKGAHDPALIRPMEAADLDRLCRAAAELPALMVTLAPESATPEQVGRLAAAGAVVSLGHSDAPYETCREYIRAGARCVTHLFNAMSQLGNRTPGLVGAALQAGEVSAGLIADGIHVHPASIATALAAKRGPGAVFLVTDAMATAGSDLDHFTLNGRRIERREGRLTLADGTLAGADLEMAQALRVLTGPVGLPPERALAMATAIPADLAGLQAGRIEPGRRADFVHLDDGLRLRGVWRGGASLAPSGG
ncbi:MAG: N-acetylglucosamine-6-phosphate deacetylase [Alphaproteobacteria bacterium]|nr:MAG: N-acetylglucosamine-6-phosphate deacetylase [Alphaproteobacteria bacterium]